MRTCFVIFTAILLNLFVGCGNSNEDGSDSQDTEDGSHKNSCGYEDGTHSATVDYNNPETGYNATYTLDVQVADCEVTEIDFPKGGWLDDTHIAPAEVDEDGDASIEDDRGRTFDVHIAN